MARLARIVIPGIPHHVTQRGNRREQTFFERGDYEWSSAKSRVRGKRTRIDPLTDMAALEGLAPNWRAMLRHGLEAGGAGAAGEAVAETIETRLRTGRPLAVDEWIMRQEAAIGRRLCPAKRGPKPKSGGRSES